MTNMEVVSSFVLAELVSFNIEILVSSNSFSLG